MLKKLSTLCALSAIVWGGSVQAQNLPGSEWAPVEMSAEAFEPVAEIFLRFEKDGRYFGNGGCNTFRGAFVTNEAAILFSPAAATMMACPEEVSRQEFEFLKALMTVRAFERAGVMLTLTDNAGKAVLKLRQRDAD